MKRAIINGQLIDVKTGTVEANTVIVWENDKITEIGQDIKLSKDVEVIDAKGAFVSPGFIHACSQLGMREYGVRWEGDDSYEASDAIHPHLSVLDGIYPFDDGFEVARQSGITTVHVLPGPENVISGRTAIIKTSGTVIDDMIVEKDHGLALSLGEIPKKSHARTFNKTMTRMGIASVIREQFKKTLYGAKQDPKQERIFQQVLNKELPVYIRAHRTDDILTAIRLKEEFDINMILVHGTEAHLVTEQLLRNDIPVLAGPFFVAESRDEMKHLHPSSVSYLREKGVPFALTNPEVRSLLADAVVTIREGLSMNDALYSLTYGAANILGVSDQIGSIEIGKQADLVLFDGHPLELKSNVLQTISSGTTVYKKEDTGK